MPKLIVSKIQFYKMNENENKIEGSHNIRLEELENLIENDDTGKYKIHCILSKRKPCLIFFNLSISDEQNVLIPAWLFKLPPMIEPERIQYKSF